MLIPTLEEIESSIAEIKTQKAKNVEERNVAEEMHARKMSDLNKRLGNLAKELNAYQEIKIAQARHKEDIRLAVIKPMKYLSIKELNTSLEGARKLSNQMEFDPDFAGSLTKRYRSKVQKNCGRRGMLYMQMAAKQEEYIKFMDEAHEKLADLEADFKEMLL